MKNERGKQLETAVERYLTALKIPFMRVDQYRCFKCGQVQNASAKGWPDFYLYGHNIAIECKTGKGQLTKEQKEIKQVMERAGTEYHVVKNTVDQLIKLVQEGRFNNEG